MPKKSTEVHTAQSIQNVIGRLRMVAALLDGTVEAMKEEGVETVEIDYQYPLVTGMANVEKWAYAAQKAVNDEAFKLVFAQDEPSKSGGASRIRPEKATIADLKAQSESMEMMLSAYEGDVQNRLKMFEKLKELKTQIDQAIEEGPDIPDRRPAGDAPQDAPPPSKPSGAKPEPSKGKSRKKGA